MKNEPQMTLNALQVETAKPRDKAFKLADGGGLCFMANTNGSIQNCCKTVKPNIEGEIDTGFWFINVLKWYQFMMVNHTRPKEVKYISTDRKSVV